MGMNNREDVFCLLKLGVNTVLFKPFSVVEAMKAIKLAGYDGVELSAIAGMCEHLVLDDWENSAPPIKAAAEELGLQLLSMEVASLDEARLEKAFAAARYLGVPVVNVGPSGRSDNDEELQQAIATLNARAELAATYGVTLCCKAHVGASIYSTPTTLEAARKITSSAFGVDMDPSHIHRAGEKPEEALAQVVQYMKHVHIRDCKGEGSSPGTPALQACGRGDINLFGYFKELVKAGYDGPVCLEVIGPDLTMQEAMAVASESYGYMNCCLKQLGAR
jgi:sugar phosphate isomerase/epimerase